MVRLVQTAKSLRWQAEPNRSISHDAPDPIPRRSRTPSGIGARRSLMPDWRTMRSTMVSRRTRAAESAAALTYAFPVRARMRCLSRRFGTTRPPRLHGVMTAKGSASSMCSHTSGSWALPDPSCGTLNTDALPVGTAPSCTTVDQPPRSRSEQHHDVAHGDPEHDGDTVGREPGILVSAWPASGASRPSSLRKLTKASSAGASDQISLGPRERRRRLAPAQVGVEPASPSREKVPWISRTPDPKVAT